MSACIFINGMISKPRTIHETTETSQTRSRTVDNKHEPSKKQRKRSRYQDEDVALVDDDDAFLVRHSNLCVFLITTHTHRCNVKDMYASL